MKIERKFTTETTGAYGAIEFTKTISEIRNPDGKIVFRNDAVEVPSSWSQVASDVLAQKYFRKAGIPAILKPVKEKGVPEFLHRSVPDLLALKNFPKTSSSRAKPQPSKCLIVWRALGAIGAGRGGISRPKGTRAPIMMKCASCWRAKWPPQTHPNGLIRAYIGLMVSMDQVKAISMLIMSRASL